MGQVTIDEDIFERLKRESKYRRVDLDKLTNQILRETLFKGRGERRQERKEKERDIKEKSMIKAKNGDSSQKEKKSWWSSIWKRTR